MGGFEVPPQVVQALGRGKRPRVIITIKGHSWRSRVVIMRGHYLLGLSNANRQAAGVVTGEEVEIELAFDPEAPGGERTRGLRARPVRRSRRPRAYDRLTHSRKREHVRAIERAKKPETRNGGSKRPWRPYGL
jgi:hypothetical protein